MADTKVPEGFTEVADEKMGRAFSWDDEIEKDDDFIVLPDGDYYFRVEGFERGRHPGSEKLPPCPKAIIKIKVFSDQGEISLNHNLFLHSRTESMISAFFVGIGLKKKGERLKMDWNKVVGAEGKLKLGTRTYNGNTYNDIKKFYRPDEYLNEDGTEKKNAFTGW